MFFQQMLSSTLGIQFFWDGMMLGECVVWFTSYKVDQLTTLTSTKSEYESVGVSVEITMFSRQF